MAEPRLTFRRLVGLDRSVVPAETARDQPLRPFTLPNAIGMLRFAGLPVFLVVAFSSGDGVSFQAAAIYFAIAGADYLDGMAARLTGQYSRFGALLDPLVDRLLVLAGVVVSWNFELLPRWLLGVLAARELFMLVMSQIALRRGQDVSINWVGRWAVWPTMSALFLAMLYPGLIASLVFGLGVLMSLLATALYVRVALQWEGPPSTSS
ncbi:MAG: CDP-alcohol phosphatidyltransferase family protein [Thermoleophilaceae bacterium]|nr:CDP-alcohol phosphatidyltransferase family protein [Thermoleophilaceae bacterium]